MPAAADALGTLDHALVQARHRWIDRLRLAFSFRLRARRGALGRLDPARPEAPAQPLELALRIAKVLRRPDADQPPAEALEDHLVLEQARELVALDRATAIAQDADPRVSGALDDEIDRVCADRIARHDAVSLGVEDPAQLALELGVE